CGGLYFSGFLLCLEAFQELIDGEINLSCLIVSSYGGRIRIKNQESIALNKENFIKTISVYSVYRACGTVVQQLIHGVFWRNGKQTVAA
ncbi:12701_t:CDS:2, partial [Dentiscutata heterogama]